MTRNVRWFAEVGLADLEEVGGKNASLGEMVGHLGSAGVRVPDGFATTAEAYRRFLGETGLAARIDAALTQMQALPEPATAAPAMADWLSRATAYSQARAALSDLSSGTN